MKKDEFKYYEEVVDEIEYEDNLGIQPTEIDENDLLDDNPVDFISGKPFWNWNWDWRLDND